jgi:chaperonin GroES
MATKPRLPVPLYDRVLVRPMAPAELTKSGLIIPDMAKEVPGVGVVLAVGPGRRTESGVLLELDQAVVVGVTVRYQKHAGVPVPIEGDPSLLLIRAGDLLAVELPA